MCQTRFILKSSAPVLFCRYHNEPALEGETPDLQEQRTWKERAHYDENGKIIIPGYMIQKTLEQAGKLTGERINGKKTGKAMHKFLSQIRVIGNITTDVDRDIVEGLTSFVSSNGKPDGPKVPRTFPKVNNWKGVLTFVYPDLKILNEDIIQKYLDLAGACIGIGHWRPDAPSKGSYGTFTVKKPKPKTE